MHKVGGNQGVPEQPGLTPTGLRHRAKTDKLAHTQSVSVEKASSSKIPRTNDIAQKAKAFFHELGEKIKITFFKLQVKVFTLLSEISPKLAEKLLEAKDKATEGLQKAAKELKKLDTRSKKEKMKSEAESMKKQINEGLHELSDPTKFGKQVRAGLDKGKKELEQFGEKAKALAKEVVKNPEGAANAIEAGFKHAAKKAGNLMQRFSDWLEK